MKTLELSQATSSLAKYAKEAKKGTVVVTAKGKPIAAVIPFSKEDLESAQLAENPRFVAMIQRSRSRHAREGGISTAEMRRRLGLKAKK